MAAGKIDVSVRRGGHVDVEAVRVSVWLAEVEIGAGGVAEGSWVGLRTAFGDVVPCASACEVAEEEAVVVDEDNQDQAACLAHFEGCRLPAVARMHIR